MDHSPYRRTHLVMHYQLFAVVVAGVAAGREQAKTNQINIPGRDPNHTITIYSNGKR